MKASRPANISSARPPAYSSEIAPGLRDEPAMVAVFADHSPPPKLEGITEAIDIDEGDTEYEDAE